MAEQTVQDVRSLVLGGGVKAKRQALYIERFGGWFNLQELYGHERGRVLQEAVSQKTKAVNVEVMYAGLVVQSLRYPHPDAAPPYPEAPVAPDATAPTEEQEAYEKALAQYQEDVAKWAVYPGLHDEARGIDNPPHPQAGEKVFNAADRDAFSQNTPGQIIEEIAKPSFVLSGFNPEDIDEKKANLKPTVISSSATILPIDSTS